MDSCQRASKENTRIGIEMKIQTTKSKTQKICQNCVFWTDHCGLYSTNCITAIASGKPPTAFLTKEDTKPISGSKRDGKNSPVLKGEEAFMNDEEYDKAEANKKRHIVMYPDMRELTDESKEEMRKFRAEDRRKKKEAKS